MKIPPPSAVADDKEKIKEVSVSNKAGKRVESDKSEEDDEEEEDEDDIPAKKSKVEGTKEVIQLIF